MIKMNIRPGGTAGLSLAYAVGSFARDDDSYIITQLGGESPFGSVLASLGSEYAASLSPDGSGRSMYGGLDITNPLGNGKGWYLRDSESGEVWSPFFAPTCEKADEHEVAFSPGQATAYTLKHKIAATLTIATLPDRPVEVWLARIENRSAAERSLTFTTYVEPCVGPDLETSHREREKVLLLRRPLSAVDLPARSEEDLVLFHSSTLTPVRYQTEKSKFIGEGRTLRCPQELDRAGEQASDGPVVRGIASFTVEVKLPIEGEAEFAFVFGVSRSPEQALETAKGLSKTGLAIEAVQASRRKWEELCSTVRVDTPDRALNALVNTWLPYEAYAGWIGRRTGGVCLDPFLAADSVRRFYALAATAPEACRESLASFAAGISVSGTYSPDNESIVSLPPEEMLWLPACVARYIAETGDAGIAAEPLAQGGDLSLTLKDQCERVLRMCGSASSFDKAQDEGGCGLPEHVLELWSTVTGSSELPLGPGLANRRRPSRPEHPEERSLPRRMRYLQTVCPTLAGSGIDGANGPESDCGVACWAYSEVVERILGVQPSDGGLRIRPQLPDSWTDCEITRRFRGDTYKIHISRSMSPSASGASIRVDGDPVQGDVVPHFGDGLEHRLEVRG